MGEGVAKVFLRAPNHRIIVPKVAETLTILVMSGKTRNSQVLEYHVTTESASRYNDPIWGLEIRCSIRLSYWRTQYH
jgi:hypothetical protein